MARFNIVLICLCSFSFGFATGFFVYAKSFPQRVIQVDKMKMKGNENSSQDFTIEQVDTITRKKFLKNLFKKKR